jgi:outer membrane protein TolC
MIQKLLISIICAVFVSQNNYSQDSLSLNDAIQVGLKQNYDILILQKNSEINELYNCWGEAGRYPSIDIGASQGNNISDQSNNPTSFIQELLKSNSFEASTNLSWTIFNGFKVKANKLRLEELIRQSDGILTLAIENTIHGIIISYYQAQLQREKLSLLKNVLDLSREKYKYQENKNELGLSVSFDLLQYESAYLTDSSNLILQELAFKNSVRNLNLIMGVEIEKSWLLTTLINPETNLYSYDNLKQKALSNNSNIINQNINLNLLKQDIEIAKSSFYPVLSFNSGTNYNLSSFKIASYDRGSGASINYYGNFTLSFRIYDGGKVKRGIKALEIQNEITNLETDKLSKNITNELAITFDMYQTRLKLFDLNKKAFTVAQKNFDIAKLKENNGLINSFNLRDIEMAYLSAGILLFESSYNLIESNATLLKLTGGIVQE